jgi:hypothetical protein
VIRGRPALPAMPSAQNGKASVDRRTVDAVLGLLDFAAEAGEAGFFFATVPGRGGPAVGHRAVRYTSTGNPMITMAANTNHWIAYDRCGPSSGRGGVRGCGSSPPAGSWDSSSR